MIIKIGKQYRIKNWKAQGKSRPKHWNEAGKMDSFCGQIVTIKTCSPGRTLISIEGEYWTWTESDFEEIPINENDPNYAFVLKGSCHV